MRAICLPISATYACRVLVGGGQPFSEAPLDRGRAGRDGPPGKFCLPEPFRISLGHTDDRVSSLSASREQCESHFLRRTRGATPCGLREYSKRTGQTAQCLPCDATELPGHLHAAEPEADSALALLATEGCHPALAMDPSLDKEWLDFEQPTPTRIASGRLVYVNSSLRRSKMPEGKEPNPRLRDKCKYPRAALRRLRRTLALAISAEPARRRDWNAGRCRRRTSQSARFERAQARQPARTRRRRRSHEFRRLQATFDICFGTQGENPWLDGCTVVRRLPNTLGLWSTP